MGSPQQGSAEILQQSPRTHLQTLNQTEIQFGCSYLFLSDLSVPGLAGEELNAFSAEKSPAQEQRAFDSDFCGLRTLHTSLLQHAHAPPCDKIATIGNHSSPEKNSCRRQRIYAFPFTAVTGLVTNSGIPPSRDVIT